MTADGYTSKGGQTRQEPFSVLSCPVLTPSCSPFPKKRFLTPLTLDTWSLDFNDGLPPGWETGQLAFHDLPEGSRAAARTAAVEENGHRRYQLRSHNAWPKGLLTLHDDSWLHIRFRLEKPGTFLV